MKAGSNSRSRSVEGLPCGLLRSAVIETMTQAFKLPGVQHRAPAGCADAIRTVPLRPVRVLRPSKTLFEMTMGPLSGLK